jgi:transcription elongation GreA/GreB family factor
MTRPISRTAYCRCPLPLRGALIGKSEGDVVDVTVPGGTRSYEIVSVKYV